MLDQIIQSMLELIPETYDKREGSFIYDVIVPVAEMINELDGNIDDIKTAMAIGSLQGDELSLRVFEYSGIQRKSATYATGIVTVTGSGIILQGDLFETESGIQFKADEEIAVSGSGNINVTAVKAGVSGNVPAETIKFFPVTLTGFSAVTNDEALSGAYDEESDLDLLERYYETKTRPATSGNIYHYEKWAKEISGVGDAKVIPLWGGNNTVKVVIIDSDRLPAQQALVDEVQAYIDPGITGTGEGMAPTGAFCTVVSASEVTISVSATIALVDGYNLSEGTENVELALESFLKSIAFKDDVVSYAKVGSAILNCEGISDYSGLLVNGSNSNISINDEEVAVIGVVSLSV